MIDPSFNFLDDYLKRRIDLDFHARCFFKPVEDIFGINARAVHPA